MTTITDHEGNNRRIEDRLGPEGLERLKRLVLQGRGNRELGEMTGFTAEAMSLYLQHRRPRWRAEALRQRLEDDRRIVQIVEIARPSGGYDLRPLSLPRISMHVAYLAERAHG